MEHAVVILKVKALRPMENYRKAMDENKMAELTESVRTKGVIQPILCRAAPVSAGLAVLDTLSDDEHGHAMRLVSFTLDGYDDPFRFLNCFCPSTGREYYLETRQETCAAAKAKSFGFDSLVFDAEY